MNKLTPGFATPEATQHYANEMKSQVAEGHFSDFLKSRIKLSSLGIGTFPGDLNKVVDEQIVQIIVKAISSGINVVDTGSHYRYGRALAAVGAGLCTSFENGHSRDAVFVVSKGGFITFRGGIPKDFESWFVEEVINKELGTEDDLTNKVHLLSPEYINYQIDLSRNLMGLETLDVFLIDQPEIHIPLIGKENTNKKLLKIFLKLEAAIKENRIRAYGVSTFDAMRTETDDPKFQSITSMLGLAEKAALDIHGIGVEHGFKMVQVPFNHVMTEAFTRFSHATGQGNVASTLQAAHQLGVYVMGSHTLMKGHLAKTENDVLSSVLPNLENAAQRSMQFNRSTPGLGTSLVGFSQFPHFLDMLSVSKIKPMTKKDYLSLFAKA